MDVDPNRFRPVHLTEEDVDDLAGFTGLSRDACRERVWSYSSQEMADAWRRADPRTPAEITRFYEGTDLYVWDLMQWHASDDRRPLRDSLGFLAEHYPPAAGWARVCDFGGGIGTDALFLAQRGYEVTLVDAGGPTLAFARYRFERRGIRARLVESPLPVPDLTGPYDVVLCFDVFEHLSDPLAAARRLVAALRPEGLLVQQATFDGSERAPYHLAEGVRRFGGPRWHRELAGLGLRHVWGHIYRKATGVARVMQLARYATWRITGVWPSAALLRRS